MPVAPATSTSRKTALSSRMPRRRRGRLVFPAMRERPGICAGAGRGVSAETGADGGGERYDSGGGGGGMGMLSVSVACPYHCVPGGGAAASGELKAEGAAPGLLPAGGVGETAG